MTKTPFQGISVGELFWQVSQNQNGIQKIASGSGTDIFTFRTAYACKLGKQIMLRLQVEYMGKLYGYTQYLAS